MLANGVVGASLCSRLGFCAPPDVFALSNSTPLEENNARSRPGNRGAVYCIEESPGFTGQSAR